MPLKTRAITDHHHTMCHIPYWFKIMQSVSLQHVVGLSVRNAKGFPVEQANLALNQLQNKVQTSKWRNTMKKIVALTVNQCKIRGKITSLDSKKISACYITYNRSIANYTVLHIRQKYNIKHKHKRKVYFHFWGIYLLWILLGFAKLNSCKIVERFMHKYN